MTFWIMGGLLVLCFSCLVWVSARAEELKTQLRIEQIYASYLRKRVERMKDA